MTETTNLPWSIAGLKEMIDSWTEDQASEFHTSAEKAYPEKAKYIWKDITTTDGVSGFAHWGPNFAAFYRDDGYEYWLTSEYDPVKYEQEWKANTALYSLSSNNEFKLVNPVGFKNGFVSECKKVELSGKTYLYYRVLHLGNQIGAPVCLDASLSSLTLFIDEMAALLKNITTVVDRTPELGYPSIKTPWILQNDTGVYWRYLFQWNISKEGCLTRVIGELQKYIQTLEKNGVSVPADTEQQARAKWQTALNI